VIGQTGHLNAHAHRNVLPVGQPTWAEVSAAIDTAAAEGVRLIEKLGRPSDWRVRRGRN
jgi:hypothetical protein